TGTINYYDERFNGNFVRLIFLGSDSMKYQLISNSGKLSGCIVFDSYQNIIRQNQYNKSGNSLPDSIFMHMADYPGGKKAWKDYLKKNLNNNIPKRYGAPKGVYVVNVSLIIDSAGAVSNVYSSKKFGMGKEVKRVILASGKWTPATICGVPVTIGIKKKIIFTVD
ncbi:MAG TPA: hypothetical protein VGB84_09350, partial [Arachidicoccus sp.]